MKEAHHGKYAQLGQVDGPQNRLVFSDLMLQAQADRLFRPTRTQRKIGYLENEIQMLAFPINIVRYADPILGDGGVPTGSHHTVFQYRSAVDPETVGCGLVVDSNGQLFLPRFYSHLQSEGRVALSLERFAVDPVSVPVAGNVEKSGHFREGFSCEVIRFQQLFPIELPFPVQLCDPLGFEIPVGKVENALYRGGRILHGAAPGKEEQHAGGDSE